MNQFNTTREKNKNDFQNSVVFFFFFLSKVVYRGNVVW